MVPYVRYDRTGWYQVQYHHAWFIHIRQENGFAFNWGLFLSMLSGVAALVSAIPHLPSEATMLAPDQAESKLVRLRTQLLDSEVDQASWFAKLFPPQPAEKEKLTRAEQSMSQQTLLTAGTDQASWFAKVFPPVPDEKASGNSRLTTKTMDRDVQEEERRRGK